MELFGFFGLFGVLELVALAVIFLLLVVGCTVDRRFDNEGFKWWVVVGAIALSVFWYWSPLKEAGPSGIWSTVSSLSFWMPAIVYFGIGIAYCVPEFMMDVRRAAKFYKSEWENFKSKKITVHVFKADGTIATHGEEVKPEDDGTGLLATAQRMVGSKSIKSGTPKTVEITIADAIARARELTGFETDEARELTREAISAVDSFKSNYRFKNRVVQLNTDRDGDRLSVEPKINKIELAEHVSAWTIFWPFYLVALVIGDLLTEVWKMIADFLTTFAGRFVKMTFSDVFSLKS